MRSLVHPAISALQQLIAQGDLAAARYVLDYAGFKAKEKLETSGEQVIRVLREEQPIVLEHTYRALTNGRADD